MSTTSAPLRPQPMPNEDTRPYWEAARDQRLVYQRCSACARAQFPPRRHCSHCHAATLEWRTSLGFGEVHSFTVVHRAPTPAFRDDVPYVLALVDVAEGFRLLLNVRVVEPDRVHIGMQVRMVFEPLANGGRLPQAVPMEAAVRT